MEAVCRCDPEECRCYCVGGREVFAAKPAPGDQADQGNQDQDDVEMRMLTTPEHRWSST